MLEEEYQKSLVQSMMNRFPGMRIEHNQKRSPTYVQGYPDLTFYYGFYWGVLEVKRSAKAAIQPNQQYYIDKIGEQTFASFIYPENEEEVLYALQLAFTSGRLSRPAKS